MAKQDLTLRELDEAKGYGLDADQYDSLKNLLERRWREKFSRDIYQSVKNDLDREIRPSVQEEMKPKLVEQVTKDLKPKLLLELGREIRIKAEEEIGIAALEKARQEILQDAQSRLPNSREKSAVRECVREVELDSLICADAASRMAESVDGRLGRSRTWRPTVSYVSPAAFLAVAYRLHSEFGHQSFWLWGPTVLATVLYIVFLAGAHSYHLRLENRSRELKKKASEYWTLAERAKQHRIGSVELALTRFELEKIPTGLSESKRTLDREFHPTASILQEAKASVKTQLIDDIDPERLIRVTDTAVEEIEERQEGARKRA